MFYVLNVCFKYFFGLLHVYEYTLTLSSCVICECDEFRRENTVSCQNWLHYQLISSRQDGLNVGIMWYGRYIQEPGRETNRRKKNSPCHSAACYRSFSIGLMCVTLQTRLCLNKHISVVSFPCTILYAYIQYTNCCFLFRKFAFRDVTRFINDI